MAKNDEILELEDMLKANYKYFLYGYGINEKNKEIIFQFTFLKLEYKNLFDKIFDQIVIDQWMSEIINIYLGFIGNNHEFKFNRWERNNAIYDITG